jgi:hypothetical protein
MWVLLPLESKVTCSVCCNTCLSFGLLFRTSVFKLPRLPNDDGSSCSILSASIHKRMMFISWCYNNKWRLAGAESMKLWQVNMTSQSQSCRLKWCIIWLRKVRWENIPFATSSSKEKQLPSDPGSASSLFSLTSNRTSCIPL